MAKRRKVKKGALAILIGMFVATTALTAFLVIFVAKQIALSKVKITFINRVSEVEVHSELTPEDLIKSCSGMLTYAEIDTSKLGEFTIEFKVTNEDGSSKVFKHNIVVVDTTPPEIKLSTFVVKTDEKPNYKDIIQGPAIDNYDGEIEIKYKGEVGNTPGIYEVIYYATDSSNNTKEATVYYFYQITPENMEKPFVIDDIIVVTKKVPLPKNYSPNRDPKAGQMLENMKSEAKRQGHTISEVDGFRNYSEQQKLYNQFEETKSAGYTERYVAPAGHSEHQTGLAFDLDDKSSGNFENSPSYRWLIENCAEFGFILRYPKGKEKITGYDFEAWHFRYVGVIVAREIMENNLTLEEYLGLEN